VTPHLYPDAYAAYVGYRGGWPLAWDDRDGRSWPIHCYGSVGVGRDLAPDTGTGGELYAVIGHGPRHLDRNIANVGRVIDGMSNLSARPRGTGNLGFYQIDKGEKADPDHAHPHRRATCRRRSGRASNICAPARRPSANMCWARQPRRHLLQPAGGGVDICNAPVPVRRRAAERKQTNKRPGRRCGQQRPGRLKLQ
jgi:peptidylprolyl isomerase